MATQNFHCLPPGAHSGDAAPPFSAAPIPVIHWKTGPLHLTPALCPGLASQVLAWLLTGLTRPCCRHSWWLNNLVNPHQHSANPDAQEQEFLTTNQS